MYRLLITGVGSNVGQGIQKALRLSGLPCEIVGTDVHQYSAGFAWCQAAYVLPYSTDPNYTPALIRILQKHKTQLILVGSDIEAIVLAKLRDKIEKESGTKLVVAEAAFAAQCSDKWDAMQLLKKAGLDTPDSTIEMKERKEFAKKHGFPIFLKPRIGWAARDVHKIESQEALDFYSSQVKDPVLQEYLDGDEFTCAVVFDQAGKYCDHVVIRRELLSGTSFRAEIVSNPAIDAYVKKFAAAIQHKGPINLQLRVTSRGPVAFEINPRFSGTSGIRAQAGFNDVAAVVQNVLDGKPIGKFPTQLCRVLRYWDELVVKEGDPHFPK